MRVVQMVPAFFDRRNGILGGAERYALELARNMAARMPTTLLTFADEPMDEIRGSLRIRVLGRSRWVRGQRTNPFHGGAFREILEADVVHCHQQHVLMTSLVAAFCRLRRRKVFVTDLGGGGWDVSAYVSTDGWFDGHLHLSEYSRTIASHQDRANARIIHGGVDTEIFSPGEAYGNGRPVLFVGRLLPHKGIDYLIEAVPAGVPLRIVGKAMDPTYFALLRQLARGKNVSFRHEISDEELVAEYRQASCVVLPSVYEARDGGRTRVPELLGQALLEGMACGIPAIATAVASLPEIVDEAVGYLVPPNNPSSLRERIVALHSDPQRARELGQAARRRIEERFTWRTVVDKCLQAYGS